MGISWSGIKNVFRSVLRIGNIVVPMLRNLEGLIPELKKMFTGIDDGLENAGKMADDWLDKNLASLGDAREFGQDLQRLGAKLEETCDYLIVASQVETPDLITVEEGEHAIVLTNDLVAIITEMAGKRERLERSLEKLKL